MSRSLHGYECVYLPYKKYFDYELKISALFCGRVDRVMAYSIKGASRHAYYRRFSLFPDPTLDTTDPTFPSWCLVQQSVEVTAGLSPRVSVTCYPRSYSV